MADHKDHATELRDRGIVRLPEWLAPDDVRAARKMIMELAGAQEICTAGQWISSPSRFGYPKPFRDALNRLNRAEEFPDLIGGRMTPVIEALVGQAVTPMSPGQQILFSLPGEDDWSVPADAWHVDLPRFGEQASPGLQAFALLDDVEPRGGATLVIAGSHRLCNNSGKLSSRELKRKLRKEGYFQSLFDPGRAAIAKLSETNGRVHDVNLEVVELSGRMGDVYLMDLRVLHTPAPNSSDKARLMLTCRFPRTDIAAKIAAP